MNDEQLRIFIEVSDQGSFSRAEETCHISKQALLKQINSLEKEIGCPLFVRSRTGVQMTKAGEIFYHGSKRLLQNETNLIRRCRDTVNEKVLRVGSVEHQVLLNPVIEAFSALYPDIHIERIVHPNHSGEYRVANGIMDVGETFLADQKVKDEVYSFTRLTSVPYCAALSKNHPLARKKQVSLKDLVSYPTVVMPMMVRSEYLKLIRSAFAHNRKNLIERSDVDNQVEIAFSCIHSDQILITANPFISSVRELKKIPLDTGWKRDYGIIYLSPVSRTVQNFIDLALSIYSEKS